MSSLSTYVVTFNCGRNLIKPAAFGAHLFDAASSPPDLLVLCLQEIAPIGYAFLGGSLLQPYYNAFSAAVKQAGRGYVNVIAENAGLTAVMVFIKAELAPKVRLLQTAGVGVGVSDMGNKGAVGVRLGYDVGDQLMLITFVSAHLTAFEELVAKRNQDYRDIVQRLVFVNHPSKTLGRSSGGSGGGSQEEEAEGLLAQDGHGNGNGNGASVSASVSATVIDQTTAGLYLPTSHLVFAGDLNYRTSVQPPSLGDRKLYPKPTPDPLNPSHFSHLLVKDQLTHQVKSNQTLHYLVEEPINFAPTYKLRAHRDVTLDSDQQPWDWAPHRWPSWCDRILTSPTKIKALAYRSLPLFGTSDHRPVALFMSIPLKPVRNAYSQSTAPFEIDPAWKARREAARTKELALGTVAYLAWTYQGNQILLTTAVACASIWLIFYSSLLL